jgi:ATP-binding cassette subfamily F protein uup
VVTQTLAAEGGGRWREYVGGYSDWLVQRPAPATAPRAAVAAAADVAARAAEARGEHRPAAKLSYKESRELEQLPAQIEALEREQRELHERLGSPDYHRQGAAQIRADGLRIAEIEALLAAAFDRWAELDERAAAAKSG